MSTNTMPTDFTWQTLCLRSHEISKEKGWLDKPRSWAGLTRLMESELAEALEDYRNNKGLDEIYYEVVLDDISDGSVTHEKLSAEEYAKRVEKNPREFDSAKPCGIPIEFADFVIRIAQHCGTEGWDLGRAITAIVIENLSAKSQVSRDLEELLAEAGLAVSLAYAAQVHPGLIAADSPKEPLTYLAMAVWEIWRFCEKNGINLFGAIELKEGYNKTRPHRHGGKRI
jgi:hypothetical protein